MTITDDDEPGVSISRASLEIEEGNQDTYEVELDTEPAGDVTVTIGGTTGTDLRLDKDSLTFNEQNWDQPQRVTVTAEHDSDAVDEEQATLTHTASSVEDDYDGLNADGVTVTITDDDPQMEYSLVDAGPLGEDAGTVQVEVVAVTNEDGVPSIGYAVAVQSEDVTTTAGGDYEAVDETLVFAVADFAAFTDGDGETRYRQSVYFDVVIVDDRFDEDAETLLLKLMENPGYEGSVFGVAQISVSINDNDTAGVTVTPTTLEIEEGNQDTYEVVLNTRPSQDVTVTIHDPANTEVTAEPASRTFTPSNWHVAKTVTVTAGHDSDVTNEAATTITHTVSSTFEQYDGLDVDSVTVTVTDDDPAVTVSFEHSTYNVAESDYASTADTQENEVTVTVTLSAEPGRTVDITLIPANQGDTSDADYSLSATSVTFGPTDTSKTFTFTAVDDAEDDDGESVKLTFVNLPGGVSAGLVPETTVSITDDDAPSSLTVNFGTSTYSVSEGSDVEVVLTLDDDPERTVTIPLSWSNEDGASDSDHNGVPTDVIFNAGETSKSFEFSAVSDRIGDPGEKVSIELGTPPSGVTKGTTSETVVTIEDVAPQGSTSVSFGSNSYGVSEGSTTTVTVVMSPAPGSDAIIQIQTEGQNGATSTDYSLSATSVTFRPHGHLQDLHLHRNPGQRGRRRESVKLGFGTLPGGVSAGTTHETTVSINDDDTAG